jgi:hypothetical protein
MHRWRWWTALPVALLGIVGGACSTLLPAREAVRAAAPQAARVTVHGAAARICRC